MSGWLWAMGVAMAGDAQVQPMERAQPVEQGAVLSVPRATKQGEGEVSVAPGGGVNLFWDSYPFVLSTGRAGIAPVDRAWIEVAAMHVQRLDTNDAAGSVLLRGRYNLVQRQGWVTGPTLAAGLLLPGEGGDPSSYVLPGWGVGWAGRHVAFDASLAGLLSWTPDGDWLEVLPYGEVGVSYAPADSPHRFRVGLAELAPVVSYRYQTRHLFVGGRVGSALLVNYAGVELGARW